jgi:Prp8 binding protein
MLQNGLGTKRKVDALSPSEDSQAIVVSTKKLKNNEEKAITKAPDAKAENAIVPKEKRTSNLHAPIMLLTGHQAEVYSVKFSPDGQSLASASFDKQVFLWRVYGTCENFLVLKGHKNAVLEVAWSADGRELFTASADRTAGMWDLETGKRRRNITGHSDIVNAVSPARKASTEKTLLATASDDGTARVWDLRVSGNKAQITLPHSTNKQTNSGEGASGETCPVTSVAFHDNEEILFTGALDAQIRSWDLRKTQVTLSLVGHTDTITCVRLDPFGSYLLSNSMDHTLRIWDIRPYATQRNIKVFQGHQHNFEQTLLKCSWSPDGSMVSCGSSDRMVYIWDTTSRQILYKLPGHLGAVNEVVFHPKEPIIGTLV